MYLRRRGAKISLVLDSERANPQRMGIVTSLSFSLWPDRCRGNNRNYRFSFAFIEAKSEGRKSNAKLFPRIQSSGSNQSVRQRIAFAERQDRRKKWRDQEFISIDRFERVSLIDMFASSNMMTPFPRTLRVVD